MTPANAEAKKAHVEGTLAIVEEDVAATERELQRIQAERHAIDERMENVNQRLTTLRQMASTLKQYVDTLRFEPQRDMPRLPLGIVTPRSDGPALSPSPKTHAEACLIVLREWNGRPATLRELAAELQHRGWMDRDLKHPVEIVRGTMKILAEREPHRVRVQQDNPVAYAYISSGANES